MADETTNRPPNAPGKYYVDQDLCLCHACCEEVAPSNFIVGDAVVARVYKQPEDIDEERQCREAMEICPMGAIFDDGELGIDERYRD
jgi:ferredoxin